MKNKQLIIIGSLIVLLGILYLVSSSALQKTKSNKDTGLSYASPTITSYPAQTLTPRSAESMREGREIYSQNQTKQNEKDREFFQKEEKVGSLLFIVPYKGVNFSITHDYSIAKFIVIIPKAKEREGNQEFDEFLKKNGVEDRSWIRSNLLEIRYE
ncbi:hypothetical protein HY358_00535 [Candidatus Roizmanbacteria bacterium]|nr:hypothetical protein [Candidatus Roizmanbacteria bacterium]